jgi:methionyl-tRNA synthetase
METVSYKDFAKLDLRVGKVERIEEVRGADKLYKLTVDLGREKRTLVAGLRPYYQPADLHGKQLIVIANLQPKRIKGIESHGMLLAAQDGSTVAVLRPDRAVGEGSKVL